MVSVYDPVMSKETVMTVDRTILLKDVKVILTRGGVPQPKTRGWSNFSVIPHLITNDLLSRFYHHFSLTRKWLENYLFEEEPSEVVSGSLIVKFEKDFIYITGSTYCVASPASLQRHLSTSVSLYCDREFIAKTPYGKDDLNSKNIVVLDSGNMSLIIPFVFPDSENKGLMLPVSGQGLFQGLSSVPGLTSKVREVAPLSEYLKDDLALIKDICNGPSQTPPSNGNSQAAFVVLFALRVSDTVRSVNYDLLRILLESLSILVIDASAIKSILERSDLFISLESEYSKNTSHKQIY
jgi:hypothetical protein